MTRAVNAIRDSATAIVRYINHSGLVFFYLHFLSSDRVERDPYNRPVVQIGLTLISFVGRSVMHKPRARESHAMLHYQVRCLYVITVIW